MADVMPRFRSEPRPPASDLPSIDSFFINDEEIPIPRHVSPKKIEIQLPIKKDPVALLSRVIKKESMPPPAQLIEKEPVSSVLTKGIIISYDPNRLEQKWIILPPVIIKLIIDSLRTIEGRNHYISVPLKTPTLKRKCPTKRMNVRDAPYPLPPTLDSVTYGYQVTHKQDMHMRAYMCAACKPGKECLIESCCFLDLHTLQEHVEMAHKDDFQHPFRCPYCPNSTALFKHTIDMHMVMYREIHRMNEEKNRKALITEYTVQH